MNTINKYKITDENEIRFLKDFECLIESGNNRKLKETFESYNKIAHFLKNDIDLMTYRMFN
jgi:predicted nucleotidyltransferase